MTEMLFRDDAYLRETTATVVHADGAGVVLDRTGFYPRGGGQAGDAGLLQREDGSVIRIGDTVKGATPDAVLHVPEPGHEAAAASLVPGERVIARIDWERRHRHMRFHTATHLL